MITVFIFVFIIDVQWYRKKMNYWIQFSAHVIHLSKTKSEPLFIHTQTNERMNNFCNYNRVDGEMIQTVLLLIFLRYRTSLKYHTDTSHYGYAAIYYEWLISFAGSVRINWTSFGIDQEKLKCFIKPLIFTNSKNYGQVILCSKLSPLFYDIYIHCHNQ